MKKLVSTMSQGFVDYNHPFTPIDKITGASKKSAYLEGDFFFQNNQSCTILPLNPGVQVRVLNWPLMLRNEAEVYMLFRNEAMALTPDEFFRRLPTATMFSHFTYNRKKEVVYLRMTTPTGTYFTEVSVMDTSSGGYFKKFKNMYPSFDTLRRTCDPFLVSMGNQCDLPFNWNICSDGKQWKIVCALNEPLFPSDNNRVLVELADGRTELGIVSMSESMGKITITFKKMGADLAEVLEPKDVKTILSATVLGWGDEPTKMLLKTYYPSDSDLRHLWCFPYCNGSPIGYHQVVSDVALFTAVSEGNPVTVKLEETITKKDIMVALGKFNYVCRTNQAEVTEAGHYFIDETTNQLHICFHRARYPLNALAVTENGQKFLVGIPGKSGQTGANYETIYTWVKEQILSVFGDEIVALFALDNGADPNWMGYTATGKEHSLFPTIETDRRGHIAAAMAFDLPNE